MASPLPQQQQTTPPLLLSKRLTHFLQTNTSPQLPTLLLTSPHGKLLAHASPNPVSLLRTHATVAASLLAIHTSSTPSVSASLPGARTPDEPRPVDDPLSQDPAAAPDSDRDDTAVTRQQGENRASAQQKGAGKTKNKNLARPVTITVQLTQGSVVVRRLKCNLLLVAIGPGADPSSASQQQQQYHLSPNSSSQASPQAGGGAAPAPAAPAHENGDSLQIPSGTSPGGAESVVSVGGQTTASMDSTSVAGSGSGGTSSIRKSVGELARWLDDKLAGLQVPEDGLGQS